MSGPPPTSTFVSESAVIKAPLASVWHLIKLQDFSKWWSALEQSSEASGISPEAEAYSWKFKDGTSVVCKRERHDAIAHSIAYSIIESTPELSYSSVVSTITLWPVTSDNTTFIEWTGNFSSDASADVIADATFKRREALADLAKAVEKK